MKFYKLSFLFFAFLFALLAQGYAQSIKYVAYFPVPYIAHKKITVSKAYFAGADGAKVDIKGNLAADYLITSKGDLRINNTSSSVYSIAELEVGDMAGQAVDETNNTNTLTGSFIMNNSTGGILTLTNTPVGVNELKADHTLKLKAIRWTSDTQKGFVKSASNNFSTASSSDDGFPIGTTRLCWTPLRLRGSYEYQYYLIAHNGNTCP